MTQEIAFVGCSSSKYRGRRRAARKYKGQYFRKRATLAFQRYDDVYIISAKYGIVHHSEPLDDYDMKLGREVSVDDLASKIDGQRERLPSGEHRGTVLAGRDYVDAVTPTLESMGWEVFPLFQALGLNGIGYQIGWLTDRMEEIRNND